MKKRLYIAMAALAAGTMLTVGCAKKSTDWVMANTTPVLDRPEAPDWVRGLTPKSDSRIYFVGRSDDGITCLSERDAIQSARNDIHDQVRQRLAPRNVGTVGQIAHMSTDSGTCVDCSTPMPLIRTAIQAPCNAPCLHASVAGPGDCVSRTHCGPCTPSALNSGKSVEVVSNCGSCDGAHAFSARRRADCASCPTLVHAVNADHRVADYPSYDDRMDRDLNVFNVGLDSVMPALLSQLQEETAYFEEVRTTAAAKRNSRSTPEWGAVTGVNGYKAWLLCSIPREEFLSIATDFRSRYEDLYRMTLEWTIEDRSRRIDLETASRRVELDRQAEERAWNREDEIIARDHTITLDKDRHPMPGRRFGVVGSQ
ncbi:MAG: hypothetical protein P8I91_03590 [Phycisphaerales bacterium]|nr:hypothetical protein [Phycisphaerales bacterium]